MNYDFEAKQKGYRVPAWVFVERMCSVPRRLRRVAVLDTAQGLEVRHLVDIGYSPENILAVNYSAAQLAAMTKALRTDGIEGVRTKAGDYVEVLMKWDGKLDVIGFDTTSNLASGVFSRLSEAVAKHGPTVLILVALAGRECKESGEAFRAMGTLVPDRRTALNGETNQNHLSRARIALLMATESVRGHCHSHVVRYKSAVYMSTSRQPMVWAVAELSRHSSRPMSVDGIRSCGEANTALLSLYREKLGLPAKLREAESELASIRAERAVVSAKLAEMRKGQIPPTG